MKDFTRETAIRALKNNAHEIYDDNGNPTGTVVVTLPLDGLTACAALDFLKNHTSTKIIIKKGN